MGMVLPAMLVPVNVAAALILFAVAAARRDGRRNSFLPLAFWTTAVLVGLPNALGAFIAATTGTREKHLGAGIGYLLSLGLFATAIWSAARNRKA